MNHSGQTTDIDQPIQYIDEADLNQIYPLNPLPESVDQADLNQIYPLNPLPESVDQADLNQIYPLNPLPESVDEADLNQIYPLNPLPESVDEADLDAIILSQTQQVQQELTIQRPEIVRPATSTIGVQVLLVKQHKPPSKQQLYHAELRSPRIVIETSIAAESAEQEITLYLRSLRTLKQRLHQLITELQQQQRDIDAQIRTALDELVTHEISKRKSNQHESNSTQHESIYPQ